MDKTNVQAKPKKTKNNKKAAKASSKSNSFVPSKSDLEMQVTIVETNGKREIVFVAAPTKQSVMIDNGSSNETSDFNPPSRCVLPDEGDKQCNAIDQNAMSYRVPTTARELVTRISATGAAGQKVEDTYGEIISINTSDGVIESVTPVSLIKDMTTSYGSENVETILALDQGVKETSAGVSMFNQTQAGTAQTSTIVSDVGFTNLLHKHLYSTTMTGTGPPVSEIVLPEMEHTTTVAASSPNLGIMEKVSVLEAAPESRVEDPVMLVNVLNQELSKLAVPFTSTGFKPGEALPQIIFVPVLTGTVPGAEGAAAAGPPSASPMQHVNYMPMLTGSIPGAETGMVMSPPISLTNVMSPLNYGVMGAIPVPLQTTAQNMENVVYVQPSTPLLNNTVQKTVEHPPPIPSLPKAHPVSVTSSGVMPCPPNVRKTQKRRQSRQKSVSSDASSVESCETTSLMKQNIVAKKIERVRRTVDTEEELNSKVSGLVSKIMSQFPKEGQQPQPPQQAPSTKAARQSPRPAKRSKSENNNNVTGMKLPHVLQSPMAGSAAGLAVGSTGVNLAQGGPQQLAQGVIHNHAQLVQTRSPNLPGASAAESGLVYTTVPQVPTATVAMYANPMQSSAALLNALQGKRLPKVPPKTLVSRIELPSHLPSPAVPASAAQSSIGSNPMVVTQDMLSKMNQSTLDILNGLPGVSVPVQNKTCVPVRDFSAGAVVQNNQEFFITDPGLISAAAALTTLIPASMVGTGISEAATGPLNNSTLLLPQSDTIGPLEASMILSSLKTPSGLAMPSPSGVILPVPSSSGFTSSIPPHSLPMTLPSHMTNQITNQPAVHYTQIPLTAVAEAVSSDESEYETEEENYGKAMN